MKAISEKFKEQIKEMGRELDSRITFGETVLGSEELNAVTPSFQGAILKSVMKQLDIDSNVEIPKGTILKYEFGLKIDDKYEYIDFGEYIVKSVEKSEDTLSYKIICYDQMLFTMQEYKSLDIEYPTTVRNYIYELCNKIGLVFANEYDEFANYDKIIQSDLYKDLGYTYRDVFDELAQVTASTICLNDNNDLEIRYITETNDVVDEEYFKDVNVTIGEKFGAVNTIVLSRAGNSDNIYYPSELPENPYEIKISENQIMNGNDRDTYLPAIYEKLNGLEFYTNDFASTGICYYDLCDRYSVKIGENIYSCVMFNHELLITQGLEENIYTELPEQTETDYTKADKTDRKINQATLIVDKQNGLIQGVVQLVKGVNEFVLTDDTNYIQDKFYYGFSDGEYYQLEEGLDYNVGEDIVGNVYEYNFTEGLEERVSRNEFNIDSQKTTIDIISTNINTENGDVESVKTTTGYTFDKDGLKIKKDVNDYNTLIDNTGTYYKDGDTILSQTTKDGTITKDMVLYGKYYYGVREDLDVANFKKDDAMFVAELYEDNNGEEGFGHFYNGGDL